LQYQARFIELADSINSGMPAYVVERTGEALNDQHKSVRGSTILIYGVAYKRDVSDHRESPAVPIIRGLQKRGARVSYMDPYVPQLNEDGVELTRVDSATDFGSFDAVVIVTDHSSMEGTRMLKQAKVVVDSRDALHAVVGDHRKVYGL